MISDRNKTQIRLLIRIIMIWILVHTIWNYIFQKILISKGEIAACDQEVAKIVSEIDDGSIGDFVSILQTWAP